MDISKLNQYLEDGWLISQNHPTLPLIIWNYTQKTQYEQFWDEITLMSRGLVTDHEGNVISRGFSKFFNLEETKHIPTNDFEIFEKLDGQYIGAFWYDGELIVNSRGSFTSIYAIEARRILDEKYPDFKILPLTRHLSHYQLTYCFELIGFEQIVVSYPGPDLILTGKFRNDVLLGWLDLPLGIDCDIPIVKKYSGLDWKNIKELNWKNSEGFVVRFSNESRCKIKFDDYIKLHRQMTNLSTTGIWEALSEGKPVSEILNDVPDEFYDKVHWYEIELKSKYDSLEKDCKVRFFVEHNSLFRGEGLLSQSIEYRKRLAENIKNYPHRSVIFAILDNKDYSKMIWKKLKPKFEKI